MSNRERLVVMSKPFLEQIECPVCDSLQTAITWAEIDAVADPGARDALFGGNINAFTCKECGYAGQIVMPLFYDDPVRRFCVQYYPEELLDDDDWIAQMAGVAGDSELAALPAAMREQVEYRLEPHLVFDLDEMLRYIVFREKLWDAHHPSDD